MKELAFFKGTTSSKRTTIKKKPITTEPSIRDKIAQRRKTGNWSSSINSSAQEDTTTAAIPNPAQTSMGPRFKTNLVHDRRKKKGFPKLLKRFRDYYQEKGIG